jgi:hypothetical protein
VHDGEDVPVGGERVGGPVTVRMASSDLVLRRMAGLRSLPQLSRASARSTTAALARRAYASAPAAPAAAADTSAVPLSWPEYLAIRKQKHRWELVRVPGARVPAYSP